MPHNPNAPSPYDREDLRRVANLVKAEFPPNTGFIILASPIGPGGDGSRTTYTSNIDRSDAIALLKEFLIKCGAEEDWMQHIQ